jgi:hypothetical protein
MSRFGSKTLVPLASLLVLASAWADAAAAGNAGSGVDSFRTGMEKWVETRQLISKEESDWRSSRRASRGRRCG